jgi:hypothetical protein
VQEKEAMKKTYTKPTLVKEQRLTTITAVTSKPPA